MERTLADALDKCLTLISRQEATLEQCLSHYPDDAAELRPLLELALSVRQVPRMTSSPEGYSRGRARMLAAVGERPLRRTRHPVERSNVRFAGIPRPAVVALACLLIVVIGAAALYVWPRTTVAHAAMLASISGSVELLAPGGEAWQPAAIGQSLESGVRLRTGTASSASVSFFEGSLTELSAETELVLVRLSAQRDGSCTRIALGQPVGTTHNLVHPLLDPESCFQIETPAALLAVRGSEFTVTVQPGGTTSVAVTEGILDVTGHQTTTTVAAGEQTSVGPLQTPAPARPIADWDSTSAEPANDEDEGAPEGETPPADEGGDDHSAEQNEREDRASGETPEADRPSDAEEQEEDQIGEDTERSTESEHTDGAGEQDDDSERDSETTDDGARDGQADSDGDGEHGDDHTSDAEPRSEEEHRQEDGG